MKSDARSVDVCNTLKLLDFLKTVNLFWACLNLIIRQM